MASRALILALTLLGVVFLYSLGVGHLHYSFEAILSVLCRPDQAETHNVFAVNIPAMDSEFR